MENNGDLRDAFDTRIRVSKNPVMFGKNIGSYSAAGLFAALHTAFVIYYAFFTGDLFYLIAIIARPAAYFFLLYPIIKKNPGRGSIILTCRATFLISFSAALIMVLPVAAYSLYRPLAGILTSLYYILTACCDSALLVLARESGRRRGVPAFFTAGYCAAMLAMMGVVMAFYAFIGVKIAFIYKTCLALYGGMFFPVVSVFAFVFIREGVRKR